MPKSVITEGKTSTEAIEKGLKELNVSKNQVEIKILEEKKKSFFSILDPHVVNVELTLKENAQEGKLVEKKKNNDEKVNQKKKADQDDLESAKASIETFLNEFLTKISPEITYKIEIKEEKDGSAYVYINGKKYEEDYIKSIYEYPECPDKNIDPLFLESDQVMKCGPFKLDNDSYFMMGDNRGNSQDSRYWGTLKKDRFVGRAVLVFWPPQRMKVLHQLDNKLEK